MNGFSSPRGARSRGGDAARRFDAHGERRARREQRGAGGLPGLPQPRKAGYVAEPPAERAGGFSVALKAGLFALPVTLLAGVLFLLIAAAVSYADADPDRMITPLGLAALGATSVCGGFVSARKGGQAPVLCGLLSGLCFTLLIFIASLLFGDESRSAMTLGLPAVANWGMHAAVVALEVLGALIGRPRRRPASHGRR